MFYFNPSPPSEVKGNLITINYDTNYDITQIKLTNNDIDFIKAKSFDSTKAVFDISNWSNSTYTNCYLKVTHNVYASVVVNEQSLTITEDQSKSILVTLSEKPTNAQIVEVSLGDTSLASINKTSLTFTPTNWNVPQELIVTAKHRADIFKNESTKVRFDTPYYDRLSIPIEISNIDEPVWANIVPSIASISVKEAGSTTLTVTLNKQPSLTQLFDVYIGNTSVGNAMPSQIVFTKDNWNIPQTITVNGLHDSSSLENRTDNLYLVNEEVGEKRIPLTVENIDIERFGNIITNVNNISVAENETLSFTIKLSQAPTYSQTVSILSEDTSILTVDKSLLTFTKDNWDVAQTVNIKGIHDKESKEDKTCNITISSNNINSKVINTTITNIDGKTISLSILSNEMTAGVKLETDGSVATSTGIGRYITDYVALHGLEKVAVNLNKGVLRRICLYDINYNFIKELTVSYPQAFEYIVTEENSAYIRFYIQEGDSTSILSVTISDPDIQEEPTIKEITIKYSDLIENTRLEIDGTTNYSADRWITDYIDIDNLRSMNVKLNSFTLRRIVEYGTNKNALNYVDYDYITNETTVNTVTGTKYIRAYITSVADTNGSIIITPTNEGSVVNESI